MVMGRTRRLSRRRRPRGGHEPPPGSAGRPPGTATLHEHAGAAAHLSVSLTPDTITADGVATSTATATVTDAFSNPVAGDTVTFSTNGDVTFGSTTDNSDGTYSATITSSTTAGDETITGHDGLITRTATLHEHAGAAAHLSVSLTPDTITADGSSTSTPTRSEEARVGKTVGLGGR